MNIGIVAVLGVGAGLGGPQYTPFYAPNAGYGALGDVEPEWWFKSKQQRDAFCEYARFMAQHFKGRVSHYEIWNEADSGQNPGDPRGGVHLRDYVLLLEQVSSAIHEVDPDARIVAGAVGRLYAEDISWLEALLSSEAALNIDAVSWHPFYGESPVLYSGEFDCHPDPFYWREYPLRVRELVDKAMLLGFQGEFLVEEMTWRTPTDSNPFELPLYTDMVATKYLARAFLLHFGIGYFSMVSTQKPSPDYLLDFPQSDVLRHLAPLMAGHESIDMPVEIDIETDEPVAYCAFRYPNGDRMLAVWTDDIAQDEDPGVPATISFPDLIAGAVTGIDVLHGFEQELVFEIGGDDTTIRDLLVKDYPILIWLSDPTVGSNYEETAGDGFHRIGDIDAVLRSGDSDRDGDGVPDGEDFCPDWPGSKEANGC